MATDPHQAAAAQLRGIDQRYTANRRAVVEALRTAEHPLTIPELLAEHGDLAQSSAYRNLAVLERAGIVHRIVTHDDHARYELAEALTHHHHHLICASCGTVEDFTVSDDLERDITKALARAARSRGFAPATHRLDLVGTCAACTAAGDD